jgi:hypothetical protein
MDSSMPSFFPHQVNPIYKRWLLAPAALLAVLCTPPVAPAQTLARPGWSGSGLTASTWWRHAIVYAVDTHSISFQPTAAPAPAPTEPTSAPPPAPTASTPPSSSETFVPYVPKRTVTSPVTPATGVATHEPIVSAAPLTGLKAVAARMDSMQALGVDALLLRGLQNSSTTATGPVTIDPAAGTMDDFDEVLLQASRHNLRVLIELTPKSSTEDLTAVARFWLSRGIAGFRLVAVGDSRAQMRQLRAIAKTYVGERVMIGDAALSSITTSPVAAPTSETTQSAIESAPEAANPEPATPSRHRRRHSSRSSQSAYSTGSTRSTSAAAPMTALETPVRIGDGPQLLLDASIAVAPLNVAAIRMALEKNDALSRAGVGVPMLATAEGAGGGPDSSKVVATLLLSSRGGAMIRDGQEGSGESNDAASLRSWYKQMSVMQHSNGTIRSGLNTTLNHDDQNVVAWVRRPQIVSYHSPAVIFLCNMTDKPVTLSLRADMAGLRLKGSFLRTVVRSDQGMGGMSLEAVTIAPYGVYVGDLLY